MPSDKQRASIHIAMRVFAHALNEAGFDVNTCIEKKLITMSVDWTEQNFKESIGRKILTAMYPEKSSFEELNTVEVQKLFDVMNSNMARIFGISIEFPTKDYNQ